MTTSGDKMQIVGRIKGVSDEGEVIKLKLEESDGSTWEWSNRFHPSEFRGKEIDSVHRFEVEKRQAEGKRYPYRNLVKYIGPAEMPPSGEATSNPGGGGGRSLSGGGGSGFQSMEVKTMERHSIESGNAVSYVLELMKMGVGLEQLPETIKGVLENAETILEWYKTHKPPINATAYKPPAPATTAPSTNGSTGKKTLQDRAQDIGDNPTNVGELLTVCDGRWGLKREEVLEILQETDLRTIKDFKEALARVRYIKDNSPQETPA